MDIAFNLFFLVNLRDKSTWLPIDLAGGVLCLSKASVSGEGSSLGRMAVINRMSCSITIKLVLQLLEIITDY